jgi:hypothetical protein
MVLCEPRSFVCIGRRVGGMQVARFLAEYPPFDALDEARLGEIAGRVQIAFFERESRILERSGEPAEHLYVVRKGLVELRDDARVIDVLGPGESFGHPSLHSSAIRPSSRDRPRASTFGQSRTRSATSSILPTPAPFSRRPAASGSSRRACGAGPRERSRGSRAIGPIRGARTSARS